ncbi:MAG: hypothetical protein J6Y75_07765, partial [Spirochaetaceae bacterium]|nr:hypothetical protein [Spirochaetaceae bacterium]
RCPLKKKTAVSNLNHGLYWHNVIYEYGYSEKRNLSLLILMPITSKLLLPLMCSDFLLFSFSTARH